MMPEVLYKYRSYNNENNRRTLFNFEMFFAKASMFNDPFEGKIPFTYDKKRLTPDAIFRKMYQLEKKQKPNWSEEKIHNFCYENQNMDLLNNEEHIRRFQEDHIQDIDKTFGIVSFAQSPKNYLMWSHYAGCHNGFCIGFSTEELYRSFPGILGKITYQNDLPKIKLFGDIESDMISQLFTKSLVWEYEDEYRLVMMGYSGIVKDYPRSLIKKIYLGVNMKHKGKMEIIDFVKNNNIQCIIYESKLNSEKFELDFNIVYS